MENKISRKRLLAVAMIISLLMTMFPIGLGSQQKVSAATASSGSCGESATWSFDGNGTLTISGTGAMTNYSYTYYELGEIFYSGSTAPWNSLKSSITNIIIEEGITSVGVYAFCGCDKFESINFPASLKTIGEAAFFGCSSLKSVVIPETVTKIDRDAFNKCTGLTSASIPGSIQKIPFMCFSGCTALETVEIAQGITYIGGSFAECKSLKSVSIPDTVTNIDSSSFKDCTSLQSIVIPDSVKDFGWYVFQGCTGLKSITLSKNLSAIPYLTFEGCTALTTVDIPDGVKNIGQASFKNCTALESASLPEELYYLEAWAFMGCTSLKSVTFPEKTKLVSQQAFQDCTSLESITFSPSVGFQHQVFENCTSLKTLYFPKDVGAGTSMFKGCKSLTSVTFEEGFDSIIPGSMFQDCVSLSAVTTSSKTLIIGDKAFMGCTDLKKVMIVDGMMRIYSEAFRNCTSLRDVVIADTVISVGKDTFLNCSSLKEVVIPKFVSDIETHAFGFDNDYKKIPDVVLGCYEGSAGETYVKSNELTYQPLLYDITKLEVSMSQSGYIYDGTEKIPSSLSIRNQYPGAGLTLGTDYTVEYSNNINAGTAKATIKGIGKFTGTVVREYTIQKHGVPSYMVLSEDSFVYDGTQKKPTVKIQFTWTRDLVENEEYTVEYSDNIMPGTATMTIRGIGNFEGEQTKTFTIYKKTFENISVKDMKLAYDGAEHSIQADIPTGASIAYKQVDGSYSATNPIFKNAGSYRVDYKVSQDNYNDFTSYVYVTIARSSISSMTAALSSDAVIYDGTAKTPKVIIDGLTEGVDYTATYSNNTNPGTATISILGIGNYKDTLIKTFKITNSKGDMDNDGTITLSDAQTILKMALNIIPYDKNQAAIADLDTNGSVDLQDAQITLKKALNIIP